MENKTNESHCVVDRAVLRRELIAALQARASDPWVAAQRLAKLPPMEYERRRRTEAKRLGIRVRILDIEVERVQLCGKTRQQLAPLVADILQQFEETGKRRIASRELVEQLGLLSKRPWDKSHWLQPMNEADLAGLLKPLGIVPRTIRIGKKTMRGYERIDFVLFPEQPGLAQPFR